MVVRCTWVANYGEDDLMTAYHDHEWGRPTMVTSSYLNC